LEKGRHSARRGMDVDRSGLTSVGGHRQRTGWHFPLVAVPTSESQHGRSIKPAEQWRLVLIANVAENIKHTFSCQSVAKKKLGYT